MTARLCPQHSALLRQDCLNCAKALAFKHKALRIRELLRAMNDGHQLKMDAPIKRQKARHK